MIKVLSECPVGHRYLVKKNHDRAFGHPVIPNVESTHLGLKYPVEWNFFIALTLSFNSTFSMSLPGKLFN